MILDHMRRQARRLGFAGIMAFVAGSALYSHLGGHLGPLPAPVALGLAYAAAVVLAGLVTTFFLPRLRRLIEAVALSRLALACLVLAVPGSGPALAAAPLVNATAVVGGAIAILALAPAFCALCRAPRAPQPLHALAAAAERGALWLDRP